MLDYFHNEPAKDGHFTGLETRDKTGQNEEGKPKL